MCLQSSTKKAAIKFMANRTRNKYAWIIALLVFVPLILSGPSTLHAQESSGEEGTDWSAPLRWTVPGLIYTGVETAAEAGKKIVTEEVGSTVAQAAGNFVGRGLISFAAFVTWLGGTVFDYAMKEYVLEFGQNVAALESTLNTLWTLVRDVCNLAFVFGFIYIGISTIINPDSASMKRFLSRIIIGAILINFSLYFTQVVIDFTNFTATQIYTSMGVTEDKSIMVAFRTHMGLSTLWDDDPETTERLADSSASFAYYIFGAVVLLVAGLTFGITGVLLIVRFIELFLIMIFSPIIFAARIFPQTEDYSKKIIKKLLAVSFFAPAYMLLIYVALTIANALVAPPQDGGSMKEVILNGVKENPNALTVIINYCIVIILLWSSLSLAKKLGHTGGDMAISLSEKARKNAQGYMGRGVLRATGLNRLAKSTSETQENWYKSNSRLKQAGAFAMRATGVAGAATAARKAKFGSDRSVSDVDKASKDLAKLRQNTSLERQREIAEKQRETDFANALRDTSDDNKDLSKAVKDLAETMRKMNNDQIGRMSQTQLTNARVALNLTDDHLKHLEQSGTKTPAEMKAIKDARKAAREHVAEHGDAVLDGAEVQNRFTSAGLSLPDANTYMEESQERLMRGDAASLPVEYFTTAQMLPYIRPETLGTRLVAGVSPQDREKIKRNLEPWVNVGASPQIKEMWKRWSTRNQVGIRFGMTIT